MWPPCACVRAGVVLTPAQLFGLLCATLLLIGLLNCGSARLTAYMTTLGTMWVPCRTFVPCRTWMPYMYLVLLRVCCALLGMGECPPLLD